MWEEGGESGRETKGRAQFSAAHVQHRAHAVAAALGSPLTLEFLAPLRPDWEEQLLWTPCSGVDGDLSEEWSEPFSTMASPGLSCGVGERERLRRIGEQAGVLRLELLAVLQEGHRDTEERRGEESRVRPSANGTAAPRALQHPHIPHSTAPS